MEPASDEVGDEVLTADGSAAASLAPGLVAVEHQDGGAVGGQTGGDGAADAARGAGDEGGAAGQMWS